MKKIILAIALLIMPARGESLRGKVVDDRGAPVSGAIIYAVDSQARIMVDENEPVMPEKFPRVLSDNSGAFSFSDLKRPAVVLLARDLDDRFAWLADPNPDQENKIVFESPASVAGELWRGKSPVPKKEVTAILVTNNRRFGYRCTAQTDEKGKFTFDALLPGKYYFQTINPVPQVGCCFRAVPTRHAELDLRPGKQAILRIGGTDLPFLQGKITDIQGNRLHGVWVYLTTSAAPSAGQGSWSDITGRDGSYAIYDIPPGTYSLHCFRRLAMNNYSRTLQAERTITILNRPKEKDGNTFDVSIDLEPFMPLPFDKPAPPLKAKTLAGGKFDLEHQRGKIVVLHFYAGWCAACIGDFANYDKLQDQFGPDKLAVVGIDLDNKIEDCHAFLAKQNPRHPQLFAGPWAASRVIKDFHISDVPTTMIIDSAGNLVQVNLFGDVLTEFVEKQIKKLTSR